MKVSELEPRGRVGQSMRLAIWSETWRSCEGVWVVGAVRDRLTEKVLRRMCVGRGGVRVHGEVIEGDDGDGGERILQTARGECYQEPLCGAWCLQRRIRVFDNWWWVIGSMDERQGQFGGRVVFEMV